MNAFQQKKLRLIKNWDAEKTIGKQSEKKNKDQHNPKKIPAVISVAT